MSKRLIKTGRMNIDHPPAAIPDAELRKILQSINQSESWRTRNFVEAATLDLPRVVQRLRWVEVELERQLGLRLKLEGEANSLQAENERLLEALRKETK